MRENDRNFASALADIFGERSKDFSADLREMLKALYERGKKDNLNPWETYERGKKGGIAFASHLGTQEIHGHWHVPSDREVSREEYERAMIEGRDPFGRY